MKNRKVHNSNGPIPGCLGRMVNLFDINGGMAGSKRLMDKPHYDGCSRSRSRSVVPRSISPIGGPLDDKLIISEPRKNASDKTPMKMLIDHEMSKEDLPKPNPPPNLVAKLMGLDTLPRQNNDSVLHHNQSNTQGTNTKINFEKPRGNKNSNTSVSDKQWKFEADFLNQKDYKDIQELGKHVKDIDERKMALVRQKFTEAKLLVTDEKLRQTEAFQEALEFLSSHRDLFLKCLQEPNLQFSQQVYGKYTNPLTPDMQRITVLKPSKAEDDGKISESENKNRKNARKPVPIAVAHGRSKSNDECSSTFSHWDASPTAPTRIVVLKPSIVSARGIETMGSHNSSFKTANGNNFFNVSKVYDTNESREVAKEITRQMRDKLMGRQSDETLFSSVFSNGYTGDESSMNKSDNEYDGESDSEVVSPTSRHSWDYINRFSSPFSSSSFSRASCSPESSVCREAKKRLSERWAMLTLHGNAPEHRHVRRSSCTLGEMLAMSDTKKPQTSEYVGCNETSGSTAYIRRHLGTNDILPESSPSLLRSKSVPVSSSVYGDRLNVELSGSEVGKAEESREVKSNSTKVSFKGKVSSLFFSKNKKVKKAASNMSEPEHVNTLGTSELFIGKNNCTTSKLTCNKVSDESIHVGDQGKNGDMASGEDQPSPISVLEMPFGDSSICTMDFASCSRQEQGRALGDQLKSCLIDKSPPIGSISRTISRKNPCSDSGATFPITPSIAPPLESESGEDWLLFVKTLLADSGFSDEVQSEELSTRWHSADSPLDPSLREKYINLNNKAIANAANLRQWRSRCKLMYDSVNAALIDITRSQTLEPNHRLKHPNGGHSRIPLTDDVWTRIKEWIHYDARSIAGVVDEDSPNRLLVETVVKNEVVGKRWMENIRFETDEVGNEIEEKLLEQLLDDAVHCCCCCYCVDK